MFFKWCTEEGLRAQLNVASIVSGLWNIDRGLQGLNN